MSAPAARAGDLRHHPFSLRQLQYVVAVAELRSFRGAAARCHVAQPSLSAQIAQVEEVVGVVLFERSSRRVLVTPAGERFVARARILLRHADDLRAELQSLREPFSGPLRIGVIPTVSPYLLPRIVPILRGAYPRLQLLWTEATTPECVARLDAGRLDAALLAREAELGDVDFAELLRDELMLAVPSGHPLAERGVALTLADVAAEPLLLLEEGHCLRDQALSACHGPGFLEGPFRATSLSTLVQMVAAGLGITLIPQVAAPVEAARAALRCLPLEAPRPYRTLGWVWRRGSAVEATIRHLNATLALEFDRSQPMRSAR